MSILCIFVLVVLSIFWGSQYSTESKYTELKVWVVDFDGKQTTIAQTILSSVQLLSTLHSSLLTRQTYIWATSSRTPAPSTTIPGQSAKQSTTSMPTPQSSSTRTQPPSYVLQSHNTIQATTLSAPSKQSSYQLATKTPTTPTSFQTWPSSKAASSPPSAHNGSKA